METGNYSTPKELRLINRLAYFKRNHGLKYDFIGRKRKGKYREAITYNCLKCGKKHGSMIETALDNKFICPDCRKQKEQNCVSKEIKLKTLPKVDFNPTNMIEFLLEDIKGKIRNYENKKKPEEIERECSNIYNSSYETVKFATEIVSSMQRIQKLRKEIDKEKEELRETLNRIIF